MSQLDVAKAKKALATRLRLWGCAGNHAALAAGFIDDLVQQGWQIAAFRETRPQPPRADEACPQHPAYHATNCGGCNVDGRAAAYDDDAPAPTPPRAWNAGDADAGIAACRAAVRGARGTTEEDADA